MKGERFPDKRRPIRRPDGPEGAELSSCALGKGERDVRQNRAGGTSENGGLLLLVMAAGAALLVWPQAAAGGVSRGLSICSSVIIPSLFPFLVLAGFLVRSGISAAIGRRLEGLTRALFGLPGCAPRGF